MARAGRHQKARRYERAKARAHRGKHIGGSGRPDYRRGQVKGEVKHWSRPVDSGVIKKAARKQVKEIVSKSGFTRPAIERAKRSGIRLISRGRTVT
jgi:hypothetical protein